jgi:hypothetical protein
VATTNTGGGGAITPKALLVLLLVHLVLVVLNVLYGALILKGVLRRLQLLVVQHIKGLLVHFSCLL